MHLSVATFSSSGHLISAHLDDRSGFVSLSVVPTASDPLEWALQHFA